MRSHFVHSGNEMIAAHFNVAFIGNLYDIKSQIFFSYMKQHNYYVSCYLCRCDFIIGLLWFQDTVLYIKLVLLSQ